MRLTWKRQSRNGFTPLYLASANNHPEVVDFLIEKGAEVNQIISDDTTLLCIATKMIISIWSNFLSNKPILTKLIEIVAILFKWPVKMVTLS
jgi:ankyrin repeat protein